MTLSFEDAEIVDLARQLASYSGESLTSVIRTALEERLSRERLRREADRACAARLEHLDELPAGVRLSELV
jgi:hypothetical protein